MSRWLPLGGLLVLWSVCAGAQNTTFVFDRLWPALQQPWYFVTTRGIAVGPNDDVFVVDSFNHRIQRFSTEGQFTSRFGTEGVEAGEFMFPISVAVDQRGNVYVAETDTIDFRRIQKLTEAGEPILSFGSFGSGPGQFGVGAPSDNGFSPFDIEIDDDGNVWVSGSNRLQRFDPDGNFLSAIPAFSSSDNPFELLTGFDVAPDGTVFALDGTTSEILVFDPRGNLLRRFGRFGFGPGEIFVGNDVEIDDQGRIYVADGGNAKVIRFDPDETNFIEWGEPGPEGGQFQFLWRLDFDSEGRVYTVDAADDDFGIHRVQKFTADGQFLQQWGSASTQRGRFTTPDGVAVDSTGRIYVADLGNDRVQVFAPSGRLERIIGGDGALTRPTKVALSAPPNERLFVSEFESGRILRFRLDGEFDGASVDGLQGPGGVALDRQGNLYVAEIFADQIRKFDGDLNPLISWGGHTECFDFNTGASLPCADGLFNEPRSITVDSSGDVDEVVVGDYFNVRLQRFSTDGVFIEKADLEFFPTAIRAAANGDIFLLPFSDSRTNTGHFFARLNRNGDVLGFFGDYGSNPGQLNSPTDLALTPEGGVVVADALNHRIVTFRSGEGPPDAKAVIVAGGGPFPGNTLWQATQLNANFAYRALSQQGFTRDTIQYLSADQALDLDGNGLADDVDGNATVANLRQALTVWAADAAETVLYLVDHGGDETFRMGGAELLDANQLRVMVEDLQNQIPGRITIVYDACQSGSFIETLTDPAADRVIMTSADRGQSAFFVDGGALSFSNHFWTQIFNGASVGDAYQTARDITLASFPTQTPLVEADGDGMANSDADLALVSAQFIGNASADAGERPTIGSVSMPQTLGSGNSASFFADNVMDNDAVARVWGVVRPPGGVTPRDANDPVRELPQFEFTFRNPDRSRWEAIFDGFHSAGIYTVTINAADDLGNRAVPRVTTVTVESPQARRAIVVDTLRVPDAKGVMTNPATQALTAQGYGDDDITDLSNGSDADAPPTASGLTDALRSVLGAPGGTQDLLLSIAARKDPSGGLSFSDTSLPGSQLDAMLDETQEQVSGTVTVVLEGDGAGSYVTDLAPDPGQSRIVIAATGPDDDALFELGGELSFSQAFYEQVELGATVQFAFERAGAFLQASASPQVPMLEDNGNAIANDGVDGDRAGNFSLGAGIVVAGDAPLIGRITPDLELNGQARARIEISDVTTTGAISRATAIITPPGTFGASSPIGGKGILRSLTPLGPDRFALDFEDFTTRGQYQIAVYARDDIGQISTPAMTRVTQRSGAAAPGFQVNPGISGAWFDPTHDGEGWLIQILDAETALIYWFTYGPNGEGESRQVWIGAQTGRIEGPNIIIEELVTTGGPTFGEGFNVADLRLQRWGDVTFNFEGCDRGRMYYRGRDGFGQGLLDLRRITNLVGADCAAGSVQTDMPKGAAVNARHSGAWFDPTHAGEGWLLEILPDQSALSVWFTYDELGRQQWLIGLGQVSGNAIDFPDMLRPEGAFFGPTFDPASVDRARWGSMRFEFSGCDTGNMTYTADDPAIGSGGLSLQALTKIAGLGCG